MKILLVEDDHDTAEFICNGLKQAGESVDHTQCPKDAIIKASTTSFDAIIFDRLLPSMDGLDAVKILRASNILTPIIMLTALSDTAARVEGLEAGADDYLVKPFAFVELHARLKALYRRKPAAQTVNELQVGCVKLLRTSRQVFRGESEIELMPKEYQILEFLMLHPNQLVTKTMLLEHVWGFSFDPKTSLVQTHVSRLRNKLDKPFNSEVIKTIRGSGYLLSEQ
ncbi:MULTISPECIES: response regulator transcription factor [Pseudoalteromonas]|uniref:response regulator transcription factor n=1 Tax=Pseudoalteromonas TaxID=53246 RepID=UPI000FFF5FF0|nr:MULTISPECIES: response regulator transcription factor [unclassified Pseudoalteromonas]MCG9760110.1 response regulator transcription factor [Pseudoalteromonas sp. Isolate6]RXE87985.1 DNA-binding response regulator [Pseudoalteromonas sp. A757]USD29374.1 response regulator transcription factor [Pseudoalteromonas sp. SCSIO 43201]